MEKTTKNHLLPAGTGPERAPILKESEGPVPADYCEATCLFSICADLCFRILVVNPGSGRHGQSGNG